MYLYFIMFCNIVCFYNMTQCKKCNIIFETCYEYFLIVHSTNLQNLKNVPYISAITEKKWIEAYIFTLPGIADDKQSLQKRAGPVLGWKTRGGNSDTDTPRVHEHLLLPGILIVLSSYRPRVLAVVVIMVSFDVGESVTVVVLAPIVDGTGIEVPSGNNLPVI